MSDELLEELRDKIDLIRDYSCCAKAKFCATEGYIKELCEVLDRAPTEAAKPEAGLSEANRKLVDALNRMQEFHDCMEAQRKDEPLPEGHDDPDESCGDGVCFQVGNIIKRGIEVARLVTQAPSAVSEAKEADKARLDALLFEPRLDLRLRREDGNWSAGDLETDEIVAIERDPRRAIDIFLSRLAAQAPADGKEEV